MHAAEQVGRVLHSAGKSRQALPDRRFRPHIMNSFSTPSRDKIHVSSGICTLDRHSAAAAAIAETNSLPSSTLRHVGQQPPVRRGRSSIPACTPGPKDRGGWGGGRPRSQAMPNEPAGDRRTTCRATCVRLDNKRLGWARLVSLFYRARKLA